MLSSINNIPFLSVVLGWQQMSQQCISWHLCSGISTYLWHIVTQYVFLLTLKPLKKLGNIWESEIRSVAEIVLLAIGIIFTSLFTLWYLLSFIVFILVSSSGGATDEGLVGELERQEGAAGAVQRGHQQRPGRIPYQLLPTTPGHSGWRRSQHRGRFLSPQGLCVLVYFWGILV